jgi:hypothetical protein
MQTGKQHSGANSIASNVVQLRNLLAKENYGIR